MDSVLPEWYSHDEATLERIVVEGTIALDANVMLDLYRVGASQRDQILSVLRSVKDRLHIPYQAAYEFQKNRLSVASEIDNAFEQLPKQFAVSTETLNKIRDKDLRAEIQKISDDAQAKVTKQIEKLRKANVLGLGDVRDDDPIRAALDRIIGDSVGTKPPDDVLEQRTTEAHRRNDEKIPPGFMDFSEKADPTGDYLIWAELLEYIAQSDRPLLFVTNDEKKDWRHIHDGQTIGPRVELLIEMRDASVTNPYHQANLSSLLHYANEYLAADVDDETIEAVESVARQHSQEIARARRETFEERLAAERYLADMGRDTIAATLGQTPVTNWLDRIGNVPGAPGVTHNAMLAGLGVDGLGGSGRSIMDALGGSDAAKAAFDSWNRAIMPAGGSSDLLTGMYPSTTSAAREAYETLMRGSGVDTGPGAATKAIIQAREDLARSTSSTRKKKSAAKKGQSKKNP